jgi:FtsZ-interacting cell division protein ZipA
MGRRPSAHASGTNTPRDLNSNIKLLELYTLHILPRNNEWDYAREFILMSEMLDDERKEAFLQALQGLKEESEGAGRREQELQEKQREQLEEQRRQAEQERIAEERRAEDETRRREEARKYPQKPPDDGSPTSSGSQKPRPTTTPASPTRPRPSGAIPTSSPSSSKKPNGQVSRAPPRPSNHASSSRPQTQMTLYKRAAALFSNLQTLVLGMGQNPMALMRMLLFILMFAFAFGRRDVRERIKRAFGRSWEKVAATVGMGTKVSYI